MGLRQALSDRVDKIRIRIPPVLPNWDHGVVFDEAGKVALDDGIPLAYVPPAEIVTMVLAAPSATVRRQVLAAAIPAIAAACATIVTARR